MTAFPSGEQHEIAHGDQRAVVVEVGGGLREYSVGAWQVLDGYPADEMCSSARGQVLMPWPNRVRDGRWSFGDADYQLDLTEVPKHNAIHGLVRWDNWTVRDRDASSLRVGTLLHNRPGYPFVLDVEVGYALGDDGLTVTMAARNAGDGPAPVAAGMHPYVTVGTDYVDPCTLHVPAARYLPTDQQQIPTGVDPVDGTPYDLRTPRPIGGTAIDYAYADLDRGPDGRARVRLTHPDGDRFVEMWLDRAFRYVEVFTGDTVPQESRQRRGLGLEPMTAPPNAMADGTDLVVLQPNDQWTGSWGLRTR